MAENPGWSSGGFDPSSAGAAGVVAGEADDIMTGQNNNGYDPDRLSENLLAQRYGYALEVLRANPELWAIFQRAFDAEKGQWTKERFEAAIKNSDWYQNNASFAREAWVAEMTGGADWAAQVEEANLIVQEEAAKWGVTLTEEQKKTLARRYIYEGWGLSERKSLFARELSQFIAGAAGPGDSMAGAAGSLQTNLRSVALNNGVDLDESFYRNAAQSVMSGLTTPQDWDREIREQAASYWPVWRDQIMAGMNARDLASGYINTMARTYELDPNTIELNDPFLRQAMTGVDEKGNPRPLGLWDFEQQLRRDPRWMNTKQGVDTVSTIALDVLKTFGFQG